MVQLRLLVCLYKQKSLISQYQGHRVKDGCTVSLHPLAGPWNPGPPELGRLPETVPTQNQTVSSANPRALQVLHMYKCHNRYLDKVPMVFPKYLDFEGNIWKVFCFSAGIGRTGTFIALDVLSRYGKVKGKVNIIEYVKAMRKDRMTMIQNVVSLGEPELCVIYRVITRDSGQEQEHYHNLSFI